MVRVLIEMEMWPPLIAALSKKFIGVLLVLATLLSPVEVVICVRDVRLRMPDIFFC